MFKKKQINDVSIGSGKKIIGFLIGILGFLFFLSIWFLLEKEFVNMIKIEDICKTAFKLLKSEFKPKIWESDFYIKIINTIFSVFVSFTICFLVSIFAYFFDKKLYYFKSFFLSIKIIKIFPILFIAYLICLGNISFNNETYHFDNIIFPTIITFLVNCSFFVNSFKKVYKNEINFFDFVKNALNLTFTIVITSETILSSNPINKIDKNNIGGLITDEFNKDNVKVLALILIFCLIVLTFDLFLITLKKIDNLLFNNKKKR